MELWIQPVSGTSGDVISGDAMSGDATSGRACAHDNFRHHHTAPPQMLTELCRLGVCSGTATVAGLI
jgi:hypothetical protein